MFDSDPYGNKPRNVLTMGEWLTMLVFLLVVVCVGFLIFRQVLFQPFLNAQAEDASAHKK